jgi:hypothetical protein
MPSAFVSLISFWNDDILKKFLHHSHLCLSVVSSTNLDGWQVEQIKRMIAGGNPAAHEFFKKQGMGPELQGEAKYSNRVAQLYRAHLDKLAQLRSYTSISTDCDYISS